MVEELSTTADKLKFLLKNHDANLPQKGLQQVIKIRDSESNKNNEKETNSKMLRENINVVAKSNIDVSDEILQLQKELDKQKQELDRLLVRKEQLESRNKSHVIEKNEITNQLTKDKTQLGKCILSMENNIKSYKDILGLDFKKYDNDTMTFIYRYVFINNPSRTCSFDLQLKKGVYKVLRCDPDVGDVNKLVTSLNTSNDFRQFILKIRDLFLSGEVKL